MILRLAVLMIAGAVSYLMFRGWPEAMPALPRAFVAIFILVITLVWWTTGRKPKDLVLVKSARKPGWLDLGAIGLSLIAVECAFLWFLTAAPEPLEDLAVRFEKEFRPEAAKKREEQSASGEKSGNWLWDDRRQRPLPKRTNLKPGIKPEVFVRLMNAKDAERLLKNQVYVRAFALDRYENGAWSLGESNPKPIAADPKGWIRFSDRGEGEILHEVFHGKDVNDMNVLTALQGVKAVRLPSLTVDADGMVLLPKTSDEVGYEYLASSMPVRLADVQELHVSDQQIRAPDAGSRIGQLVLRMAGEGDLLTRLKAIEDYLRKNFQYSLVTDNRKNLDPIENFLFEEKRGHCEFFATAAALMARELGVESRVAYGWSGGKYFEANNMFVFRAREAHAWVEVNLAGYGWVLMEPTSPTAMGAVQPKVAKPGEKMPTPDEVVADPEEIFHRKSADLAVWASALALGCGVAAVILFVLSKRKRVDSGTAGDLHSRKRRESGYFVAWRRALHSRGIETQAGHTIRNQVENLDEDAPEFSKNLIRYHYSVRYEGSSIDQAQEKAIEKAIDRWERS